MKMSIGEHAKLTIDPDWAYGKKVRNEEEETEEVSEEARSKKKNNKKKQAKQRRSGRGE